MSEEPNPSWSAERMESYMKEKYGEQPKVVDRNGRQLSWKEMLKLVDSLEGK